MKRKVTTSNENLLHNVEPSNSYTIKNDTNGNKNILLEIDNAINNERTNSLDRAFIMNKFFNEENISNILTETSSSQYTFKVTSPKVLKKVSEDQNNSDSSDSNKTYNVLTPKVIAGNENNKQSTKVGDVLIHHDHFSPTNQKIIVVTENRDDSSKIILEKAEIENLNDISKTITEKESSISSASVLVNEEKEEIIELTKIEYKNEVNESIKIQKDKLKDRKLKDTLNNDDNTVINEARLQNKSDDKNDKKYSYNKIIEIIVHKTDRLLLNSLVVHPVVKIHLVDMESGMYFPKSDKKRPVVFYYENSDCNYISPIITHPYNLQDKRTFLPSWEETILLNEDYEYFLENSQKIIIFFEVLDFITFSQVQNQPNKNGWHNIAFAFLKPTGKNNASNINKKLRLQLYYINETKKYNEDPTKCFAWILWKTKKLIKYPSTLYVTIKSVVSPGKIVANLRSKMPVQAESSKIKLNYHNDLTINKDNNDKSSSGLLNGNNVSSTTSNETNILINFGNGDQPKEIWSRSSQYETCKLPNKCLSKFDSYDEGCFVMRFSWSGLYLACAVHIDKTFSIVIYEVKTLEEVQQFSSHQAMIYGISWSEDDSIIISASADNTVSIWNFFGNYFMQILPHPSFVYTAEISTDYTVATGCYDGIIRIWNKIKKDNCKQIEFNLAQELEHHYNYITSTCFNKKSNILYSSDANGIIIEWTKASNTTEWKFNREISLLDLKDIVINNILLFPKEKRLLVHSRDSILRIIDIKSTCVLHRLLGGLNRRVQLFSTISPCGNYILSGSEDGFVNAWNAKSGTDIATYIPFPTSPNLTIHCVQFHPIDNIIAISHYGVGLPILVYSYDKNVKGVNQVKLTLNQNINLEPNVSKHKNDEKVVEKRQNYFRKIAASASGLHEHGDKKFDFESVLRKMDDIIVSQVFKK